MVAKSKDIKFAGDINVEHVSITSLVNGNKFNVTDQLLSISIFEDLFSPFITGSLIFRESLDFASNFPFIGEEVIDLRMFTPTLDKDPNGIITGRFYIYKMADREKVAERSVVYQLHFISVEAINDINTKISEGFEGQIHEIVGKLLGDDYLNSTKKHRIDLTSNKTKYISNFWSPIRNINFLTERALDTNNNPTYIFFENRQGFNFVTLDSLNSKQPFQEFLYNQNQDSITPGGGSKRVVELDFKKITDMEIPVTHDYMDRITNGTYGSTIIFMDLTKKKYMKTSNNYLANWKDGNETHLNKYPIASNTILASTRATMFNDTIHNNLFTDYEDVSSVPMRLKRISRLKAAEAFTIKIVVAGRTDYTVGQKVFLKSYKTEPIKKDDPEDKIIDKVISGNYLIASINHVMDRQKHECHMNLIKDSLMVNLG